MIEIKDRFGKVRFATEINAGSKRKFLLMKEDYLTLKFSLDEPVHFKLGDFVEDVRFGLFEICDLCKPSYNPSNSGYDYELRLDAYYWKWKNKLFKYMPETARREVSWNLTASLDMQMGVLLKNLKVLGYTYKGKDFECAIDKTVENKAQLMSYSNTNLLDAVFEMANKWDCECWITENIIHFGRCEFGTPIDFKLGENVDTMTRSDSQTDYATRIYAFGSTRNIPSSYRKSETANEDITVNGIVQKRLMLPVDVPYIDAYKDMPAEEAVEGVVVYEDIFPKNTGVMSDITTKEYIDAIENKEGTSTNVKWNAYRFKDTSIIFSKKYILPDETPKITFQSGLLNGMEFEVAFNPCEKDKTPIPEKLPDGSWNPTAQVWEILRNEDYGRPIPDDVLRPKNGDTYILSGFDASFVSDTMIPKAEKELEERAKKDLEKRKIDPSTYEVKMMSDRFFSENGQKLLEVGSRVNLVNSTFFETGNRESRIIGSDYNLDMPYDSPVYTVGETTSYSRVRELEDKIDSITYKGQLYTGGNGGTGIYLITSNDITPATDKNTFSAKRIIKELEKYLHKDKEDETDFPIKFLGGLFTDYIQSLNFSSGPLGSGLLMKVDPKTGKSYIEVDELFVRMKAMFTELEIKKLTYTGGNYIFSAAGMKCARIEEYDNYWRCYLMVDDGETAVENPFREGDQIRYQELNVKPGVYQNVSNRYYWRLCVAVGNDYIDLSKTDCDKKSDSPQAGDSLVQLGNRTNPSRQNAIALSVYGDDAPSIRQYADIRDYSMDGKEVTIISPKGNKFLGDFISISTGKSFDDMFIQLKTDLNLIKEQADKEYTLWFFDYPPTLDNIPASEWTTDADKAMHEQDMFYNRESGLAYRFEKNNDTWSWNTITDHQTVKALESASHAQDTADGKQRTFVAQPTDGQAYDVGDLWVNANYSSGDILYENDALVCKVAKTAGAAFSIDHWQKDSKYTDDTKAEEVLDYTKTKVQELQTYADKAAQAKAAEAETAAKAHADKKVTASEAAAIDAANKYAIAQDELLKIATDAYADGVVSVEEARAIQDAKDKAAVAEKEAKKYADLMDAGAKKKLLNTGIDMDANTITATADKFTIQGRDGSRYAVFEVDSATGLPMMKADYIKVTSLLMANAILAGGLNIGNKFVVTIGEDGNATVKLTGEIDATQGHIGAFNITDYGLRNASEDPEASIAIEKSGGRFFRVNDRGDSSMCAIRGDEKTALGISAYGNNSTGISVIAQAGYGTTAISSTGNVEFTTRDGERADIDRLHSHGMYYNIKCIAFSTTGGNYTAKETDDVICVRDPSGSFDLTISLPASMPTGKVIYIKNQSNRNIRASGNIMYANNNSTTNSYTLNAESHMFIYDGTYWVDFYCG